MTVQGPTGRMLEGAEVWLVDPATVDPKRAVIASRTLGDWVGASRAMAAEVVLSDEQGNAVFRGARPKGFLVAARSGALFGLAERREALGRGDRVELSLVERKSYRVALRNAAGAPAAGVQISLAAPDPGTPDRPYMLPATAVTDARGEATLFEPPAAAKRVLEGLDQIPERLAVLRLPARGLEPLELRDDGELASWDLPWMNQLHLVAQHAAFSQDHWAGLIQVFPSADGSRSSRTLAQSLAGGTLELPYVSQAEDLRAVVVISEASAPGRFIGTMTLELETPSTREASKAVSGERLPAPRTLNLPLDAGLILTGRCVDADGAAMGGETIDLFVVGDASTSWTLVTDDEGRFRWLLFRPGKPLAKVVVGARSERVAGDLRATTRLGDVAAGQVVDLGVLTLK